MWGGPVFWCVIGFHKMTWVANGSLRVVKQSTQGVNQCVKGVN